MALLTQCLFLLWQDIASSSLPGPFLELVVAIPPPATKLNIVTFAIAEVFCLRGGRKYEPAEKISKGLNLFLKVSVKVFKYLQNRWQSLLML